LGQDVEKGRADRSSKHPERLADLQREEERIIFKKTQGHGGEKKGAECRERSEGNVSTHGGDWVTPTYWHKKKLH